ncbi:Y-family DNA polymerase [Candidatus Methylacidithermus pantelleriae]|uniref:Putative Nucleotidyltransferase/DNA polymerase involved in DNA repair-like protein n=1 Tax=Candidatus Methylacidithermus pantelleriae TaxID=2744239 RepID=A0A8J2FUX2_9BACT|nr:hypothetical protein [Candidatus Methylacidithermus pantelleriae]CAF0704986.1 putative Nucleotidyltransferase/DNA polymerase involved in DNA repair-like protein [Candidatus Methylacidithermus pantelleriae]
MFAVVYLPSFSLQAILRSLRPAAFLKEPWGLWELCGSRPVLTDLTPLAQALGVSPGMNPKEAQGRVPQLKIVKRSLSTEKDLHYFFLKHLYTLCPRVEATSSGVYTLDLSLLPQNKNPQKHLLPLIERSRSWNLQVQVGIASTPELAFFAARQARPILWARNPSLLFKQAPVSWAGFSSSIEKILRLWGIQTLGEFLSLPHEELVRRLGKEVASFLQKLTSSQARPLRVAFPRDPWKWEISWEHPIETRESLLASLSFVIKELSQKLSLCHQGVKELRLHFQFEDKSSRSYTLPLAASIQDPHQLFRILCLWMEHFQAPTRLLSLEFEVSPSAECFQQGELFGPSLRNPMHLGETLTRLEAFLGESRVGRPLPAPSHCPDRYLWKRLDPWEIQKETWLPSFFLSPLLGIPLRRFRPPIPIEVRLKEAVPIAFRRKEKGWQSIIASRGPWNFSGEWWTQEPWEYQLWEVQTDQGEVFLVFRMGKGWELAGRYLP